MAGSSISSSSEKSGSSGSIIDILGGMAQSAFNSTLGNYFNKKAAKKSYKYALDMWNRSNEYNKPINQVARLREAGLNPQLALGNISSASSAHLGSTPQVSSDVVPFDYLNYLLQKKEVEARLKRTDAETININEDSNLKRANIKLANAQTLSNLEQIKMLGVQMQEGLARISNLGFQNDILKNKLDTGITGDDAFSNSLRNFGNLSEKFKDSIKNMLTPSKKGGGSGR